MCCKERTVMVPSELAFPVAPIVPSGAAYSSRSTQSREEAGMAGKLVHVKVAPKGMGLNDFVAHEEGFYADEGIEVELDWKTFRGTQSSWKKYEYFQRPHDNPYAEGGGEQVVQCACVWGTISNASAGMGRMVADCHGVSPWAIFVRPESRIRRAEDLRDVPIAVGMRAGSHFNVPFRLEKYLALEHIKTANVGGFGARADPASRIRRSIRAGEALGSRRTSEGTLLRKPDLPRRTIRN